jgi:hypothetical protein
VLMARQTLLAFCANVLHVIMPVKRANLHQ